MSTPGSFVLQDCMRLIQGNEEEEIRSPFNWYCNARFGESGISAGPTIRQEFGHTT